MDSVRSLLPSVLRKRGLFPQAEAAMVVHKAEGWLSKELPLLSPALHVHKVQHGTLHITADHSAILAEATEHMPRLQSFLQQECPAVRIDSIALQRGKN